MRCTTNYYTPRIFPKYEISGHKQKESCREAINTLSEKNWWEKVQQLSKEVVAGGEEYSGTFLHFLLLCRLFMRAGTNCGLNAA